MQSEWEKVRLGNYSLKIGSGSTPRGGNQVYLESGTYSLIRSQNILDNAFSSNGLVYIDENDAKKLNNVNIEENDVLLNITGDSVARVCKAPKEYLPARVNQHVSIIRTDENELNSSFLNYYLNSKFMQTYMLSLSSTGATRKALTKSMIENFLIPKPPLKTQKKIANILSVLDDKIELNRKINQTLEEMAQVIFKSWFVDFDPVHALANRGDRELEEVASELGISKEILELFPSEFEESELGIIPKGWEIKSLDNIAHYQNGLALQKFRPKDENNSLPVLKIAQLKKGYADAEEKADGDIKKECIVNSGDIVFSWSGSLVVDVWCGGKVALNQHLFKVTSIDYTKWFYYYWTKQHLINFQQIAKDKAVTMGHIKRSHLEEALCSIPDNKIFKIGENMISPLLDKLILNRLEITDLQKTRDTLLPKLLSGELDVSELKL